MRKESSAIRLTGQVLLLVLPLVWGSRLALDTLAPTAQRSAVEAQHTSGCASYHNHTLCVQLLRTHLSPPGRRAATSGAPELIPAVLPPSSRVRPASNAVRIYVARAPPTRA